MSPSEIPFTYVNGHHLPMFVEGIHLTEIKVRCLPGQELERVGTERLVAPGGKP